jgi:hypothetical protein
MTVWRNIPGFSRYSASADGRIRLDVPHWGRQPRILQQRIHQAYYRVHVAHDWGFSARIPVHRLVALAFLGEPPYLGAYVLHNDGHHLNNCESNLRYGTPAENTADMLRHGSHVHGEDHPDSKLTEADVREIVERLRAGETQASIGRLYGVTQRVIWQIASGGRWKHVTSPLDLPPLRGKGYRGKAAS